MTASPKLVLALLRAASCPFCAGAAHKLVELPNGTHVVVCMRPGCHGCGPDGRDYADAVDRWNRRCEPAVPATGQIS